MAPASTPSAPPAVTQTLARRPPLPRTELDRWPLAEAGLPTRVVHAATQAGLATVGELRAQRAEALLGLRHLGPVSLGQIHAFFDAGEALAQDRLHFPQLREALRHFLDATAYEVLSGRFGLEADELLGRGRPQTLQQIGARLRKTRERIRQIEREGLRQLHSRLARHCLAPFADAAAAWLGAHHGTADADELRADTPAGWLAGCDPAGALRLLGTLQPERFTVRDEDLFSLWPAAWLEAVAQTSREHLQQATAPVPLQALLSHLPAPPRGTASAPALRKAAAAVLARCPSLMATQDARYFLPTCGAESYLLEVLRPLPRPAHYRRIAAAFSADLAPHCRCGAGFVLELLRRHPQCRKTGDGYYDLR